MGQPRTGVDGSNFPFWWKEGGYLLFTDIHNTRRMKYTPGKGVTEQRFRQAERPRVRPPPELAGMP